MEQRITRLEASKEETERRITHLESACWGVGNDPGLNDNVRTLMTWRQDMITDAKERERERTRFFWGLLSALVLLALNLIVGLFK